MVAPSYPVHHIATCTHGAFAPLYLLHYCILCTQCATLAPLYKVLRPHLHIEKWLQIPNYLQSLGCKVGLLIIKVLKVPFHSVSKAIGPITNLTLTEPAIRSCIKIIHKQPENSFCLNKLFIQVCFYTLDRTSDVLMTLLYLGNFWLSFSRLMVTTSLLAKWKWNPFPKL